MEGVASGKIVGLRICTEYGQDRVHKQNQKGRKGETNQNGSIGDKGRSSPHPLFIFFTHGHAQDSASAHAEHIGEGHHQNEDGVCQTDCGYLQRVPGLSHKKGVRHIIEDGYQTADDTGNGHNGHRPGHFH